MKKFDDITMLHVSDHRHENLFKVPTMIGGFYNWHRTFGKNGFFNLFKAKEGRLKEYDIIFIGMSRPELEDRCATQIREELGDSSDTKLVVCIDYAVELWQGTFQPRALEYELKAADMVFVSEPCMQNHVQALLKGEKPVHHIPHPSQIDHLSKLEEPYDMRDEDIVVIIHRYDNNWLAPFLVTDKIGYNTHAVCLDNNLGVHLYPFFKYIEQGKEFTQYLSWLAKKKLVVDSYHKIHTYGRSPVDCACIGVPCIGTNWTWAQKKLWPDLTVEPGYVYDQRLLVKKIMEDEDFYHSCVEKAKAQLDYFSYENRKKDFLTKLYGEDNADKK